MNKTLRKPKIKRKFRLIVLSTVLVLVLLVSTRIIVFGLLKRHTKLYNDALTLLILADQHYNFISTLKSELLSNKPITVNPSADECNFGKFLKKDTANIIKLAPSFKPQLKTLDSLHKLLHYDVIKIKHIIKSDPNYGYGLAMNYFSNHTLPIFLRFYAQVQTIDNHLKKLAKNIWTKAQIINGVFLALLILLLTGIIVWSAILYSSIYRSIEKVSEFSRQLIAGNLFPKIDIKEDDELGVSLMLMISAVNIMAGHLSKVIDFTNQVLSISEQLSTSAEKMAHRAQEQASATEELSTLMEQMQALTEQNAVRAEQSRNFSNLSTQHVNHAEERIKALAEVIKVISERITIIDEIAAKIDILAINASIVASRAGKYGREFSVIAEQIRNLAISTQKAANEIINMISIGVKASDIAIEKSSEVFNLLDKVMNFIDEIYTSAKEQSDGVSSVTKSVSKLSNIAQQNAEVAEQLASTAEELNRQSSNLRKHLQFFKLKKNQ